MNFGQFMKLPTEIKIRIIRKCSSIAYTRLRRTCRYVEKLCEKNRKDLGVYCHGKYLLWDGVLMIRRMPSIQSMVYMARAKDMVPSIRKSLSGFAFDEVTLLRDYRGLGGKKFDEALDRLLETAPDLKTTNLNLYYLPEKQAERVKRTWKALEIKEYS